MKKWNWDNPVTWKQEIIIYGVASVISIIMGVLTRWDIWVSMFCIWKESIMKKKRM